MANWKQWGGRLPVSFIQLIFQTVRSTITCHMREMRGVPISCFGLLLLSCVLSPSTGEVVSGTNEIEYFSGKAHMLRGESANTISPSRLCGANRLAIERKNDVQKIIDAYQKERGDLLQGRRLKSNIFNISTYVHVVYKGNSGDVTNVSDSKIIKQIDVLNDAFNGSNSIYTNCNGGNKNPGNKSPFRFVLKNVTRTLNETWHYSNDSNYTEMTKALRKGSCADLNIFINAGHGSFGFGSYPSECSSSTLTDDFVVIQWKTLPGTTGYGQKYNKGGTLVHQVGHWLGLYDTYEGGCDGFGDYVSDTPAELNGTSDCTGTHDSCPLIDGQDPVENFMHSTRDCCAYKFSDGQLDRMLMLSTWFRSLGNPTLSVPEQCSSTQWDAEVVLETDENPGQNGWYIGRAASSVVGTKLPIRTSFSGYGRPEKSTVIKSVCLDSSQPYFLVIVDTGGDGISSDDTTTSWKLNLNGVTKASGGFESYHKLVYFGVPETCSQGKKMFLLLLRTDDFPNETSWVIKKADGSVLEKNLSSFTESQTLTLMQRCLPAGLNLIFEISDSNQNGLCCDYGMGFFGAYIGGQEILTGDVFGASKSKSFNT